MIDFKRDTKFNIFQRINAVMSDVHYIEKEKKQVNGQYRFVSHDAVSAKLQPFLAKYGIVVVPNVVEMTQEGNRTSVKLEVTFINIDAPKDTFSVTYYGYGLDGQDKGIGKAVSYAFKYAMLKTFCLETGDDPDTDAKTTFTAVKPEDEKKALDLFLSLYDDDEIILMHKFINAVCEKYKKTITEFLECNKDRQKFCDNFFRWKKKQDELKSNEKSIHD